VREWPAQPKVYEPQVALLVEDQILRLYITVNQAVAVQMDHGGECHRSIEPSSRWFEPMDLSQQVKELATPHGLHQQKAITSAFQPRQKLMVAGGQCEPLTRRLLT
jgi:hypothetical protein